MLEAKRSNAVEDVTKRRPSVSFWLLLVAAVPSLGVAHILFGRPEYETLSHVCAAILGGIAITSWILYFRRGATDRRPPLLEVYVSYQYSLFGMSVFFVSPPVTHFEIYPRPESYAFGSFLVLVSVVCFILGFLLVERPFRAARVNLLLPQFTKEQIEAVATPYLVFTAIVLFLNRLQALGDFTSLVVGLFSQTTNFALQLFLFLEMRSFRSRVRLFLAVLIHVALFFFHSSLEDLAQVFVITLIGYFWLRQKVRWDLLLVGAFAFMLLQPMKSHYRDYAWRGDMRAGELQDQGSAFDAWEYAYSKTVNQTKSEREKSDDSSLGRLSELPTLAFTVEAVPSLVPFQGLKATFEAIAIGTVPRLLWPSKPSMTAVAGSQFTQMVGITTWEQDQYTATSFPLVCHSYLTLGVTGVMFWSALYGALACLFSSLLSPFLYRIVLGVGFSLTFSRSLTLVVPFASVWQTVVAWFLFGWCVILMARFRQLIFGAGPLGSASK